MTYQQNRNTVIIVITEKYNKGMPYSVTVTDLTASLHVVFEGSNLNGETISKGSEKQAEIWPGTQPHNGPVY